MSPPGPRSPQLSLGLPVYNGERFLPQILSCLLGQTFDDFELIVCDNASSDGTRQICLDHARRDTRVRYVRNERNLGAIANFNLTLSLSQAPFFKWVAHDDLYAASYLATCMDILDKNPDVVLAHSASAFIDEDGKEFAWDGASGAYVDPWTGVCQRPDSPDLGNSSKPAERFWQILGSALWGSHMLGVVRRPILLRTRLLENYVSSDRAMLGELALLGRFQSSPERLFMKRFHQQVSWALDETELREFLSTGDKAYSRRGRQLRAFFSVPWNKPIGSAEKMLCTGMVAVHCLKVFGQVLARKDMRNAAQGRVWRQKRQISA